MGSPDQSMNIQVAISIIHENLQAAPVGKAEESFIIHFAKDFLFWKPGGRPPWLSQQTYFSSQDTL